METAAASATAAAIMLPLSEHALHLYTYVVMSCESMCRIDLAFELLVMSDL